MKTRILIISLIGIIVILGTLVVVQNFVESKELSCLRLYKDIHGISRTNEMQLAEREAIQKHKDLIFEYVEKDCPYFQDLDLIYSNYKPNSDQNDVRCSSGGIPYIPDNWQSTGMHPSDETWETLNRHLMAQFFFKELQNRNIVFEPACFGVYTGFADAIYPPRFSMCSVVTASNGTDIYLEGSVNEFDVIYFDIDNKIPYQCDDNHGGCLCGIENEN